MTDNNVGLYEAELAKWHNKHGAQIAEINRQIEELQQRRAKLLAERNKVVRPLTNLIAALSPEDETRKPTKVTKPKTIRGRRTPKPPMIPVPDNLGKGTKIQMLAGKYSGQEGKVSSVAENNGDRTFFVLLDGGKSTSTKIGTIGKSWKTLD